jgi:hypothetical protein
VGAYYYSIDVLIKDYSRQDKSINNIIECMCTDGHAVKEE